MEILCWRRRLPRHCATLWPDAGLIKAVLAGGDVGDELDQVASSGGEDRAERKIQRLSPSEEEEELAGGKEAE